MQDFIFVRTKTALEREKKKNPNNVFYAKLIQVYRNSLFINEQ